MKYCVAAEGAVFGTLEHPAFGISSNYIASYTVRTLDAGSIITDKCDSLGHHDHFRKKKERTRTAE